MKKNIVRCKINKYEFAKKLLWC